MIGEAAYIELMKNCSKWNTSIESERKKRYPFLDSQTGIAQRPTNKLYRSIDERYGPSQPGQIYTYPSTVWQKRPGAPSSDATELKYFCHTSSALAEALSSGIPNDARMIPLESSSISPSDDLSTVEKRDNKPISEQGGFENGTEDLSPDEPIEPSDEDEWSTESSRRKRRKRQIKSTTTTATTATTTPTTTTTTAKKPCPWSTSTDAKPFVCTLCGAKYKSRAGLNYHMAHVHSRNFGRLDNDNNNASQRAQLISSTVQVSTFCDFCLGDRSENKKTGQSEELVSCHDCGRSGHPTCLNFTSNMMISTKKYGWQCIECKSCAICGTSENDDQLLFCDDCDRGFHLYCLTPRLSSAPDGEWSCHLCQIEFGAVASLPTVAVGQHGPVVFPVGLQTSPIG